MQLSKALRVTPGTTIAFTGAGGKSAALRRLAQEATASQPVILTTTTHLGIDQSHLAKAHVVMTGPADLGRVRAELDQNLSVLVTGHRQEGEPRWTSPGNAALSQLHQLAQQAGSLLAVEADGSRGRPLKAPGDLEPLVPDFTNTLVPVMGASAFGHLLSADWVHRPETASELLGEPIGVELTPERVAKLMGSRAGGLKGVPAGAGVRMLLNQVDEPSREAAATACARQLLDAEAGEAVILASLEADEPVRCSLGRVAGVILAAGGSRRFGRPKLLEPWKGVPLVRYAVGAAFAGGLAPVVVVLGDFADELEAALDGLPLQCVVNQNWESGQSSSLRLGLEAARPRVEAAMFLLGDMPLVEAELIRAIRSAHASSLASIVQPVAEGKPGNPVLFDRSTFSALARIAGDQGGRAIFDMFDLLTVDADSREFFDLDTTGDLDWLKGQS